MHMFGCAHSHTIIRYRMYAMCVCAADVCTCTVHVQVHVCMAMLQATIYDVTLLHATVACYICATAPFHNSQNSLIFL